MYWTRQATHLGMFHLKWPEAMVCSYCRCHREPVCFLSHIPDWSFGFDMDRDKTISSRKRILDMASAKKMKLLGYHWPYPGLGMAEAKNGA